MTELITTTKNHLKRIFPDAKDISIRLERDHEKYLSKIHVQVPGKVIHAEKKAETVWEAIDSSCQAVLKQVEKFRTKRFARKKIKREKYFV
jgi:ribosomal subunit interface protein